MPVHPVLLQLGLLNYHASIATENHIRLFPDLNKSKDAVKFGKQPSKQLKSVVTAVLGEASKKTFYSLRYTFVDFYKQRGLQNDYFRQVFGHELPMPAAKQYGEKFSPKILYKNVIMQFDYSAGSKIGVELPCAMTNMPIPFSLQFALPLSPSSIFNDF